ncbi:MAG TPA: hypothetical protein VKC57_12330 [Ktedonobacterales bacterium]|nr:hypothetical protein [Ktedonobacterales bacterium]
MDDDFELEVTDLRTGRTLSHATNSASASPPAVPTENVRQAELLGTAWRPAGARPPSGARRLRAAMVVAAVLLVTVLLLGNVPDSRTSLGALLHLPTPTPTPTAPLAFGADQFSAVNGVPWGVLRSDGKQVALSQAQTAFVFSLPRGRHTLEYRAEPFPVLRCVVTVPVSPRDTCPLLTATEAVHNIGVGRYLDFRCTPQALPAQQVAALETVIQRGLDALQLTTTAPPGARYLGADGTPQVARAALTATFSYRLNLDVNESFNVGMGACITFCGSFASEGAGWIVAVHALFGWHFAGADIAPIDVPAFVHTPPDTVLPEQVTWRNGWQLDTQMFYNGQLCGALFSNAFALVTSPDVGSTLSVNTQAAPNPADGCLYTVTQSADTSSTASALTGTYLYRFGLLFAVNNEAQRMQPSLPAANAEEQKLARNLAVTQPLG